LAVIYKNPIRMKKSVLIIGILISFNLFGQVSTKKDLKYIPKNFDEALIQLDRIIADSTKTKIKSMEESDYVAQSHFTTGMWIRNNWLYNRNLLGLIVTKSDLRKDLTSKGLFHNDDMSVVILRSFHRQLNNVDINLDQQIKDIHQWHINMNNPEWRAEQDSISWSNYMAKFEIGDTLTRHLYYDRNWLGEPRKNSVILATITDKSDRQLKINLISFDNEQNKNLIYQELNCEPLNCWVEPNQWRNKNNKDR